MAERLQRTYRRSDNGPLAIDDGHECSTARNGIRNHRENNHREQHRLDRGDSQRTRMSSSRGQAIMTELSYLKLEFTNQPPRRIQLDMPIDISAILSIQKSKSDQEVRAGDFDMSPFFAAVQLLTEGPRGERWPVAAMHLTGQSTCDSFHPISEEYAERLRHHFSNLIAGQAFFPGLIIEMTGTFRIRITLFRVIDPPEDGAEVLRFVDSEPIKVEMRSNGPHRRIQLP